ncbi:hypothetical protein MX033_07775 [Streptococcus uberis]|uniref:hypothetical protein n=1 Tax=Streptococcus uberis TaxID=1349 RepID=UPI0027DDD60C|nr:hypothetical protein [Streptococcus uberis]MCK1241346.1 hypothetical protein [Streptococcus uberis]
MIELTFKGNNLEEVFAAMREALKGAKPKKAEPVKEEQVEEKPIEKVEKAPLTLDEIHKMTSAKAQEGKSKEIKKLLAEMDVEKVINIPEDKFEWYVKKLEAL